MSAAAAHDDNHDLDAAINGGGTLGTGSMATFEGVTTLEMQRRLLAKTKTDKVNTLLKKSK